MWAIPSLLSPAGGSPLLSSPPPLSSPHPTPHTLLVIAPLPRSMEFGIWNPQALKIEIAPGSRGSAGTRCFDLCLEFRPAWSH